MMARPPLTLVLFLFFIGCGYILFNSIKQTSFPKITREGVVLRIDWNIPIHVDESRRRVSHLLKKFDGSIKESNTFVGEKQFLLPEREQGIHEAEMLLSVDDGVDISGLIKSVDKYFSSTYPRAILKTSVLENIFDKIFTVQGPSIIAHFQDSRENTAPAMSDLRPVVERLENQGIILQEPALQEEFSIRVLFDQVMLYDIDFQLLYDKLETLFSRHQVGRLKAADRYIPINLGTEDASIYQLIDRAEVHNKSGQSLPLKHFVIVEQVHSMKTITAGKAGESLDFSFAKHDENLMANIREAAKLSGHHTVTFSGQYFESQRTVKELSIILMVCLFLLFLILAAQFESLVQPLIVMLTVPVGIAGSLLALYMTAESINIISIIGMIVMGGIVVNDAILKVDMINRARKDHSLVEAIHIGGERRLKPIIMTSLTTILALSPILFVGGLGAELQRPLAIAVIGGLILGTISSLYFIPVIYKLLSDKDEQEVIELI